MSSRGETDTKPNGDFHASEARIDKTVSELFDELFAEISSQNKLHNSEQVNRDAKLLTNSTTGNYDLINSYHAFCRLCEQHFYTLSFPTDINSFFQKHINTSYHRQMRHVKHSPDDAPMFTWEKKFHSGQCNVCQISGLNSYIIDTRFEPLSVIKVHTCYWNEKNLKTNEKTLKKLILLKKYCGLSVFREKFIKAVNQGNVCLLCEVRFPGTVEEVRCHLHSDMHYLKFLSFVRKYFDFSLNDVLNGFNLEWLFNIKISTACEFKYYDEREICMHYSNSSENPYPQEKYNYSYSPKDLERLQDEDVVFIENDKCLLCGITVDQKHMSSYLHLLKSMNLKKESFVSQENFEKFCENRQKRLQILDNYKKLERGKVKLPLKSKNKNEPCSHIEYFKNLLDARLKLLNSEILRRNWWEIYCYVCDQEFPAVQEKLHLNSVQHVLETKKWDKLKPYFVDKKFSETFVKIKNIIVCLLCNCVTIHPNLYTHLKGKKHIKKYKWYASLGINIPISSALKFSNNLSCTCTICGALLNEETKLLCTKTQLSNLSDHWPCPELKNKKNLNSEPKANSETEEVVDSQDTFVSSLTFEQNKMKNNAESYARDLVDFQKVEKAMENIVNVFEDKIIKSVYDKSAALIDKLDKSGSVVSKTKTVTEGTVNFLNKKLYGCACPASTCSCSGQPSVKDEEKKLNELVKNNLSVQNTENEERKSKEMKETEGKKSAKKDKKEKRDALVISGLSESEKTYDHIHSKLKTYGKIKKIYFRYNGVAVIFAKDGVAEIASKCQSFLNSEKVTMTVTAIKNWKKITNEKTKLHEKTKLDEKIVGLLKNPQELMNFVQNLLIQADEMSQSSQQLNRERLVCTTIIEAVTKYFPTARCYPFGSRLSGLALDNSDLDVFLDCGDMYNGFKNTSKATEIKLLNKVSNLLKTKQEIEDMVVVSRARVPIVSFLHRPTLMHCDLSFKSGLSVQNSLFLRFMVSLDWRVKSLILFLKYWAKLCKLHGPPFFSSYSLAMLVIYYLEQLKNPVVPTIESLQNKYMGRRVTIEGWDCSINTTDIEQSNNNDTLPQLLAGLFEFYATYNYKKYVISPLTGTLLPREAFTQSGFSKLPLSYKRHVLNILFPIESWVSSQFPICIIDPFDLSHVLTKTFTVRGLTVFKSLCLKSAECLRKELQPCK